MELMAKHDLVAIWLIQDPENTKEEGIKRIKAWTEYKEWKAPTEEENTIKERIEQATEKWSLPESGSRVRRRLLIKAETWETMQPGAKETKKRKGEAETPREERNQDLRHGFAKNLEEEIVGKLVQGFCLMRDRSITDQELYTVDVLDGFNKWHQKVREYAKIDAIEAQIACKYRLWYGEEEKTPIQVRKKYLGNNGDKPRYKFTIQAPKHMHSNIRDLPWKEWPDEDGNVMDLITVSVSDMREKRQGREMEETAERAIMIFEIQPNSGKSEIEKEVKEIVIQGLSRMEYSDSEEEKAAECARQTRDNLGRAGPSAHKEGIVESITLGHDRNDARYCRVVFCDSDHREIFIAETNSPVTGSYLRDLFRRENDDGEQGKVFTERTGIKRDKGQKKNKYDEEYHHVSREEMEKAEKNAWTQKKREKRAEEGKGKGKGKGNEAGSYQNQYPKPNETRTAWVNQKEGKGGRGKTDPAEERGRPDADQVMSNKELHIFFNKREEERSIREKESTEMAKRMEAGQESMKSIIVGEMLSHLKKHEESAQAIRSAIPAMVKELDENKSETKKLKHQVEAMTSMVLELSQLTYKSVQAPCLGMEARKSAIDEAKRIKENSAEMYECMDTLKEQRKILEEREAEMENERAECKAVHEQELTNIIREGIKMREDATIRQKVQDEATERMEEALREEKSRLEEVNENEKKARALEIEKLKAKLVKAENELQQVREAQSLAETLDHIKVHSQRIQDNPSTTEYPTTPVQVGEIKKPAKTMLTIKEVGKGKGGRGAGLPPNRRNIDQAADSWTVSTRPTNKKKREDTTPDLSATVPSKKKSPQDPSCNVMLVDQQDSSEDEAPTESYRQNKNKIIMNPSREMVDAQREPTRSAKGKFEEFMISPAQMPLNDDDSKEAGNSEEGIENENYFQYLLPEGGYFPVGVDVPYEPEPESPKRTPTTSEDEADRQYSKDLEEIGWEATGKAQEYSESSEDQDHQSRKKKKNAKKLAAKKAKAQKERERLAREQKPPSNEQNELESGNHD